MTRKELLDEVAEIATEAIMNGAEWFDALDQIPDGVLG